MGNPRWNDGVGRSRLHRCVYTRSHPPGHPLRWVARRVLQLLEQAAARSTAAIRALRKLGTLRAYGTLGPERAIQPFRTLRAIDPGQCDPVRRANPRLRGKEMGSKYV